MDKRCQSRQSDTVNPLTQDTSRGPFANDLGRLHHFGARVRRRRRATVQPEPLAWDDFDNMPAWVLVQRRAATNWTLGSPGSAQQLRGDHRRRGRHDEPPEEGLSWASTAARRPIDITMTRGAGTYRALRRRQPGNPFGGGKLWFETRLRRSRPSPRPTSIFSSA